MSATSLVAPISLPRSHIPVSVAFDPNKNREMPEPSEQAVFCTKDDGYRGIWWGQTATGDEYAYKYSGGLGTYPVQNAPLAVYRPEVHKTFFVYGGTTKTSHLHVESRADRWNCSPGELLHMVSFFDHATGQFPQPTILLDKWTADPHDNPVLSIDDDGYLWVFSPSHGHWTTPSYIHRSTEPYSIDRFETVSKGNFSYPQVWAVREKGIALFYTLYAKPNSDGAGRGIFYRHGRNGSDLDEPVCLGRLEKGHYQVSTRRTDGLVATAFDFHPTEGGLEARTNIYYAQSADDGQTWTDAAGRGLTLPVESQKHPARIRDFLAEGLLVYIKDMVFDSHGRPVILFVTSKGWQPGPTSAPHTWNVAFWGGEQWDYSQVLVSDNNYDMGSLFEEPDGGWRIIGTTGSGPQEWNTGGEVEIWSKPPGTPSWHREKILTAASPFNHSHPRRPYEYHPDFAVLWMDGHARQPSESRLYISDLDGEKIRKLPAGE